MPTGTGGSNDVNGETVFTTAQKSGARVAILELAKYTGIKFVEKGNDARCIVAKIIPPET